MKTQCWGTTSAIFNSRETYAHRGRMLAYYAESERRRRELEGAPRLTKTYVTRLDGCYYYINHSAARSFFSSGDPCLYETKRAKLKHVGIGTEFCDDARRIAGRKRGNPNPLGADCPCGDGKYTWIKGDVKKGYVYGAPSQSNKSTYVYEVRYDLGLGDIAWFEEQDLSYLTRLLQKGTLRQREPDVWYLWGQETGLQGDIADWWVQKLKLDNIDDLLKQAKAAEEHLNGAEAPWEGAEREAREREQAEQDRREREAKEKADTDRRKKEQLAKEREAKELKNQGKNKAISCYDQVVLIDKDYMGAWNNKGEALQNQEKHAEAISCFKEALRIDENFEPAWYNQGVSQAHLDQFDVAISCYDKALEIDKNDENAWDGKGVALGCQDKFIEAIPCYDEALRIDENYIRPWSNKGFALKKLGKYIEAIGCYDKALLIDEDFQPAKEGKGDALSGLAGFYYEEKKDIENAIVYQEKAVKVSLDDACLRLNLACYYHENGRLKEAEVQFKRAIELEPGSDAFCEYGLFLFRHDRCDEAVTQCVSALEVRDDQSELFYNAMGKSTLPKSLQMHIPERGELSINAASLAYYVLGLCYLQLHDQTRLQSTLDKMKSWLRKHSDSVCTELYDELRLQQLSDTASFWSVSPNESLTIPTHLGKLGVHKNPGGI